MKTHAGPGWPIHPPHQPGKIGWGGQIRLGEELAGRQTGTGRGVGPATGT